MIISPPILKPNTNQSDEDWINSIMPVESSANEYPVLDTLAWHGGYHQIANGNNNVARAIADGKVIYARKDTDLVDYDGAKSNKGCVVIEHETEIGDNVKVKYFSIYMHLRQIEVSLDKGRKIYRKQKIGLVGQHQNENKMHFEIVCDQSNLEKIIGRSTPE
ncbi:M23 family metallopeptidase, partial [Acinetobacter bereziniae]